MRARILTFSLAVVLFAVCVSGRAWSQDVGQGIPASLSQVSDSQLRSALAAYAPHYDTLSREAQVAAYSNVYHALYTSPPIQYAQPVPQAPESQRMQLRGGFIPARPYDPKIDVPIHPYHEDPLQYNRYWDASKYGGTGVYEPWRDPSWSPMDEWGGVLNDW